MKKISNKILIIVLLALVAIFAISRLLRAPHLERNMPETLLSVDTAQVNHIVINKSDTSGSTEMAIDRKPDGWYVSQNGKTAVADESSVKGLLSMTVALKPERLVTRNKQEWNKYAVGDSSSLKVTVRQDDKVLASFVVGRSEFSRSPTGGMPESSSYVRLADQSDVYSVTGFLQSMTGRNFNGWRSKEFLETPKDEITRFVFTYPADSGFVLEKKDTVWWIGSDQANNQKVQRYLNTWQTRNLFAFAPDSLHLIENPDITIRAQGGAKDLCVIQGWKTSANDWTLKSTVQPDAYFDAKTGSVNRDVLVGKKYFISN